jgi:hypothetical protein
MRRADDDDVVTVHRLAGENDFVAAERLLAALACPAADRVRGVLEADPWWAWDEQATLAGSTLWLYEHSVAEVNEDLDGDDLREPAEADLPAGEWPMMYRSERPFDRGWSEPRDIFGTWGEVCRVAAADSEQPEDERRAVAAAGSFLAEHGHADVSWELHNLLRDGQPRLHATTRRALEVLPGWVWTPQEARCHRYLPGAAAWAVDHDTDIIPSDLVIDGEEVGSAPRTRCTG